MFVLYNLIYAWKPLGERLQLLYEVYGVFLPLLHTVVLIILAFAALVVVIINLIGFLSAVNSGNIFEKDNERRLRWMAAMFLVWYAAEWANLLLEYSFIKSSIALENYSVTMDKASIYPLVIGITFLLFANIFALGRKMKEDQEFMV